MEFKMNPKKKKKKNFPKTNKNNNNNIIIIIRIDNKGRGLLGPKLHIGFGELDSTREA